MIIEPEQPSLPFASVDNTCVSPTVASSIIDRVRDALQTAMKGTVYESHDVTAVLAETKSDHHMLTLYYPYSARGDVIRDALKKCVPVSSCREGSKAGGFITALRKYMAPHLTIMTFIADTAQLEQLIVNLESPSLRAGRAH